MFALAIPVAAALRPASGLGCRRSHGDGHHRAFTARRGDIVVGSATQVVSVVASFFTPIAIPLALIFASLWVTAVYYGRKADAVDAQRAT